MSAMIDMSDFQHFFERVDKAAKGDFRKDLALFLEGLGNEFLQIVQDEIIAQQIVDTRLLLNSFQKSGSGNIWRLEDAGLVLEVGSNVEYAKYVNYDHMTNPSGVASRWIPGRWNGDRFIYDPNANTGMLLRQQKVQGKHYWEHALAKLDSLFSHLLEAKLQQWLNRYFS